MKKNKPYLLLHLGLFIFSFGFVFSKLCSNEPFLSFRYILFFSLQILTLGIYAVIYQRVLKEIPLIIAYANKGITIIWAMLIGWFIFGEKVTTFNILGSIIIIVGIIFISMGEENA